MGTIDKTIVTNSDNVNQIETYNTTTIEDKSYEKDFNRPDMMAYQGAKAAATVAVGKYGTKESTSRELPLYSLDIPIVSDNIYGFGASYKLGGTLESKAEKSLFPKKPDTTDNSIFEQKEKQVIIDSVINKKEKKDENKTD